MILQETFRFIPYQVADSATNMALDEAILDAHLSGMVPPTLRLYGFSPPAVSLGYNQSLPSTVLNRIRAHGFDFVKRPSGGRAVLHLNDLTYCFVCSTASATHVPMYALVSDKVTQAYREICLGLIYTFEEFGVHLKIGRAMGSYRNLEDCFQATTTADLHYKGRKIVGSAQMRRQHALMQHGSIMVDQPLEAMQELLNERPINGNSVEKPGLGHANLVEIVGKETSIEAFENAFKSGFGRAFSQKFVESPLSDFEINRAKELRQKYRKASMECALYPHLTK